MHFHDYQVLANRTAKPMTFQNNLLHAALGLAGEAGEFVDAVKKGVIYEQELDEQNLKEELGDILWFCALAATTLGVNLHDIAAANVHKLSKRYPDRYTDAAARLRADKYEISE